MLHFLNWHAVLILAALLPMLTQNDACHTSTTNRNAAPVQEKQQIKAGVWGGDHIRMEIDTAGAKLEFDCAHGTISESIVSDSEGHFAVKGTFTREHGGRIRDDERPENRPAIFSGVVKGQTMTLTVKFADSSNILDSFTVTEGDEGHLAKCR